MSVKWCDWLYFSRPGLAFDVRTLCEIPKRAWIIVCLRISIHKMLEEGGVY
jgi:hypothetical protein